MAGGRVARRGRSHTSQRMLLPGLSTVQLLHCHSAEEKEKEKKKNILLLTCSCFNISLSCCSKDTGLT